MVTTDLKIALKSLRATRLRTALTILGIIIGVASVTMIMALGEGAKQAIVTQAKTLGPGSITVRSGKSAKGLGSNVISYDFLAGVGTATTLSALDISDIQKLPHISAAPIMSISGSVSNDQKNRQNNASAIIATSSDLANVLGFGIKQGSFVDSSVAANTVVLGSDLALRILGSGANIGRNIYIRGQQFTVIGIMAPYTTPPNYDNPFDFNTSAFISLQAGESINQGTLQIQQIDVLTPDHTNPQTEKALIRQILLANHGGEEDFSVLQPSDTLGITDNILRTLTLLTSSVASISLIVGGIGIMNIMLVSVTERTREIGIRKTVGATNAQILRQFLIEALLMSLTGGVLGISIAYGTAYAVGIYIGLLPVVTVQTILIAMAMSTLVGVIFGIAPALKAARKNPIEALRFFQ